MALNIKDPEADRLARELAAKTGETLTETIVKALRERLTREGAKVAHPRVRDDIMEISRRAASLSRRSGRTPDEIIGYDEVGLPR